MGDFDKTHDELVRRVLEIDCQHRYPGVKGDLWTDDGFPILFWASERKTYNGVFPVFRAEPKIYRSLGDHAIAHTRFPRSVIDVIKRCVALGNVLLAGGFVQRMINQHGHWGAGDADMFIYGLNEDEANKKLDELVDIFQKEYDAEERSSKYNYTYRNQYCVSFIICGFKFQVIFRLYKTISEILHGFDLGSCAVGWDGRQIYFTTLSRFAYQWNCNIFDLSRRSPTYQKRLIKYHKRGFSVIFPDVKYQSYALNLILPGFDHKLTMNRGVLTLDEPHRYYYNMNNAINYDGGGDCKIQMHYFNLWLAHQNNLDTMCVFTKNPKNIFIGEKVKSTNLRKLFQAIWLGNNQIGYETTISKILHSADNHRYDSRIYEIRVSKEVRSKLWDAWQRGDREPRLEKAMQKIQQMQDLVDKQADELTNNSRPTWIKENPGQQLTSSIHPTPTDPENYFGAMYSGFQETVVNRYESKLELVCIMKLRANPMRLSKDMAKEVFKYWSSDLYEEVHKGITYIPPEDRVD